MRRVAGRGGDVLLPNSELIFKPGNPLAASGSPPGRERIEKRFIPLESKKRFRMES